MADLGQIPQMAPFQPDVDPTNTTARWKKWLDRFDNLIIAMNVTDNDRKKALLLHLVGEFVFEVYESLVIPEISDDADAAGNNAYTATKKALTDHFSPKKNTEFEVYNFRLAKQNAGETTDAYHARLRLLAIYCQFEHVDGEIKSHIIQNVPLIASTPPSSVSSRHDAQGPARRPKID